MASTGSNPLFFGLFGVSNRFVAWKERGLLSCIVYAHFDYKLLSANLISNALKADAWTLREAIHGPVRDWLAKHDFPVELIGCF